mmetsp:Transcript_99028/g.266071  ORF Transcript_99028/g.266071 Transcript_99028/m.266071 type:complete len:232 (-) Transcript_99028:994-1689(-)
MCRRAVAAAAARCHPSGPAAPAAGGGRGQRRAAAAGGERDGPGDDDGLLRFLCGRGCSGHSRRGHQRSQLLGQRLQHNGDRLVDVRERLPHRVLPAGYPRHVLPQKAVFPNGGRGDEFLRFHHRLLEVVLFLFWHPVEGEIHGHRGVAQRIYAEEHGTARGEHQGHPRDAHLQARWLLPDARRVRVRPWEPEPDGPGHHRVFARGQRQRHGDGTVGRALHPAVRHPRQLGL